MDKLFSFGAFEKSKSHYATEYTHATDTIKKLIEQYKLMLELFHNKLTDNCFIDNDDIKIFVYSFNWVLCQRDYHKNELWLDINKAMLNILSTYSEIRAEAQTIKSGIDALIKSENDTSNN